MEDKKCMISLLCKASQLDDRMQLSSSLYIHHLEKLNLTNRDQVHLLYDTKY